MTWPTPTQTASNKLWPGIEAAAAARAFAAERIARRHAKLRDRIQDAVSSLDALITRETAGERD